MVSGREGIMADFSAESGRPGRQINLGALLIAIAMFATCLVLAHASGVLGNTSSELFMADSAEQ
ncbi:MAG: hypothetical protein HLUCCA04_11995 [Oceanicaulis sp. HLUCCA04]|nr:MAG: hypothetical protein HLUCCA04_11995 [Oceanicaulis sp. HLUCCA04]